MTSPNGARAPITMGGEGIFVDATPYGATAVVNYPVGMTDDPDVSLEGLFDTEADGPHEAFKTISTAGTPYMLRCSTAWAAR